MTILYIICALLLVAAAALAAMYVRARQRQVVSDERCRTAETNLATAENRLREREEAFAAETETRNARLTEYAERLARSQSETAALEKQIERDREELEKLQASFRLEFRNMANEMLEQKSAQFKELNKQELDTLLKPFKENIKDFRERVEKIYSEENTHRGALQQELKSLHELNRRITEETNALTNALKGNSKVQGDWGEVILRTILENSGLVHGQHYTVQENLKDEHGNNLRPDVILRLPGGKQIVIDSKVSLTAFVNYTGEDDAAARERHMKEHLLSFRRHVDELGSKRYQTLLDSPDFVIMFVPNEPAFMCALQNDSSIWGDAYNKKVIVSSPTNLFALLKIVDDLWKRDDQNRNAIEIAEQGGRLYDKFVGFVETLEALGKSIGSAQAGYDKAINQLRDGNGNLIARTEKLRKLGVKATKALSKSMAAETVDDTEEASADDTPAVE